MYTYTLEKPERTIKYRQSRDTGNTGYKTQIENKTINTKQNTKMMTNTTPQKTGVKPVTPVSYKTPIVLLI